MKKTNNVRIPQITSVSIALRLFYARTALSNKDIKMLFGEHSSSTINGLKDLARQRMVEDKVPVWNAQLVNTESAYKAWGLDISNLEWRYAKIKQFVQIS